MIPNTALRVVESSGVSAQSQFSISEEDSAHIMTILRDTLYSDKILAVLREYSANAWDSHKENGRTNKPIEVHMATEMEPLLSIRDFGPGLSHDAVMRVYTKYGRSTKRGSDAMVGMLGIGSKSGFAYSDSFTVISCNNGVKSTWVAVLDASEKGVINLLHEEPCGDETGVTVQIPVKPADIPEFNSKAQALFRYFEPRPVINIDLPPAPVPKMRLQNGVIYESKEEYRRSGSWVGVMGCIPYHINVAQLGESVPEFIKGLSGALYFNIGEVQINASREELKYSDETKKALAARFNALVDEYVVKTLSEIDSGGYTPWEKRLKALVLKTMGLPVPKGVQNLVQTHVTIKDHDTDKFTVWKMNRELAQSVSIDPHTRLIIKNDSKALYGYHLLSGDLLIKPSPKVKMDVVLDELNKLVDKLELNGIPILKLSEMQWTKPIKGSNGRKLNDKHFKSVFVYSPGGYGHGSSSRWEPIEREPTKDDVFVIIDRFKTVGWSLSETYREDTLIQNIFAKDMPKRVVYGYKTTAKHPVKASDIIGTEYRAWRVAWYKSLLTPENLELLNYYVWSLQFNQASRYWQDDSKDGQKRKVMAQAYGDQHLILQLFDKHVQGKKKTEKKEERGISNLYDRVQTQVQFEAPAAMAALLDRYPMMKVLEGSLEQLWDTKRAPIWAQYIKMVDNLGGNNVVTNPIHDEQ